MSDNVVVLNVATRLDVPAERILKAALDNDLESVVIAGYYKDGEEYFASSIADGGTVLWLMERLKIELMSVSNISSDEAG